jgi:prevent-host-death family protein
MKTSAKDLRLHTRRILDAIDRGQEVTITHRGKPRAKIVPIRSARRSSKKTARALPLFGIWKDNPKTKNVAAYVDSLRSGRH